MDGGVLKGGGGGPWIQFLIRKIVGKNVSRGVVFGLHPPLDTLLLGRGDRLVVGISGIRYWEVYQIKTAC